MNVLVLKPGPKSLDFALFIDDGARPVHSGKVRDYRGGANSELALASIVAGVNPNGESRRIDVAAVRVPVGGEEFSGPTLATPEAIEKLERLVPQAPLHLPPILMLLRACDKVLANVPVALVFETAFFAELPARERLYALDGGVTQSEPFRRYGFHGIFHEAASREVARGLRRGPEEPAPRILSICLDSQPEIAAVIGSRPVMVTSGVTPLEGLPGRTSCGELDPSIVLMLADEMKLGPEQINAVLTKESGILGLVGEPATIEDIFTSGQAKHALARDVLSYRILVACGAGIAAMGGLDAIVFSGTSAALGRVIGLWLAGRIHLHGGLSAGSRGYEVFAEPIERIIAEEAAAVVLTKARVA